MRVWIAVDNTKYELIYALGDSVKELAEQLHITTSAVYVNRCRARKGLERERYIPLDIPDDDEEEV